MMSVSYTTNVEENVLAEPVRLMHADCDNMFSPFNQQSKQTNRAIYECRTLRVIGALKQNYRITNNLYQ